MDGMDGMGNVSIPMTPVKIQRFAPEKWWLEDVCLSFWDIFRDYVKISRM